MEHEKTEESFINMNQANTYPKITRIVSQYGP